MIDQLDVLIPINYFIDLLINLKKNSRNLPYRRTCYGVVYFVCHWHVDPTSLKLIVSFPRIFKNTLNIFYKKYCIAYDVLWSTIREMNTIKKRITIIYFFFENKKTEKKYCVNFISFKKEDLISLFNTFSRGIHTSPQLHIVLSNI